VLADMDSMPGLLCLIAHPDDEIFCAGLLARLADQGIPIHLVCMTRGEGGGLGNPPQATRATIGSIREQEMRCSAQVLGADSLTFLDYVDPVPSGDLCAPEHDPEQLVEEIQVCIDHYGPDLVLTHGSNGDYGHPAHKLLHEMVKRAVNTTDNTPAMCSFNAFHPTLPRSGILNNDDWADIIVDVSSVMKSKISSLECHTTQWDVFVGPIDRNNDYKSEIADYARSFPEEGYRYHCTGIDRHRPHILSDWLSIEPDLPPQYYSNAFWDKLLQCKHRIRMYLRKQAHTLRNRLDSLSDA